MVNSFLEEDQGVAENELRGKFMVPKDFLLELIRTASHRPETCGHQIARRGVALKAVRCSSERRAELKIGIQSVDNLN